MSRRAFNDRLSAPSASSIVTFKSEREEYVENSSAHTCNRMSFDKRLSRCSIPELILQSPSWYTTFELNHAGRRRTDRGLKMNSTGREGLLSWERWIESCRNLTIEPIGQGPALSDVPCSTFPTFIVPSSTSVVLIFLFKTTMHP